MFSTEAIFMGLFTFFFGLVMLGIGMLIDRKVEKKHCGHKAAPAESIATRSDGSSQPVFWYPDPPMEKITRWVPDPFFHEEAFHRVTGGEFKSRGYLNMMLKKLPAEPLIEDPPFKDFKQTKGEEITLHCPGSKPATKKVTVEISVPVDAQSEVVFGNTPINLKDLKTPKYPYKKPKAKKK